MGEEEGEKDQRGLREEKQDRKTRRRKTLREAKRNGGLERRGASLRA